MPNPYSSLPERSFWRTGVSDRGALGLREMYQKRFEIEPTARISTAGSCFAQHIGRQLKAREYNYQDFEPAPAGMPASDLVRFGYNMYSARYGNIYTARQLVQLMHEAFGSFTPKERVWEKNGRYYDALRPSIEEGGFDTSEEVIAMREKQHLPAVRKLFLNTDIFVFTLGLTEAWVSKEDGTVYPTCPGTIAGEFSDERHCFKNFTHREILVDMVKFIDLLRKRRPNIKFVLTVSPVPLTATASGEHVLTATTYSKSVLRGVAGELCQKYPFVDYFPSYELITAPVMRGVFYESNLRSVAIEGVDVVMSHFFSQHGMASRDEPAEAANARPPSSKAARTADQAPNAAPKRTPRKTTQADSFEIICDEEKLDLVRG